MEGNAGDDIGQAEFKQNLACRMQEKSPGDRCHLVGHFAPLPPATFYNKNRYKRTRFLEASNWKSNSRRCEWSWFWALYDTVNIQYFAFQRGVLLRNLKARREGERTACMTNSFYFKYRKQ